jgi:hypothetical protein
MALSVRPEISRDKPGFLLFLLDQSGSMAKQFAGTEYSKADAVAWTVNTAIHNLILNCMPHGEVEDYYHFGAIGYGGTSASIAFGGKLEGLMPVPASMLAANPQRVEVREVANDKGTRTERVTLWIEAKASGKTPMVSALEDACQVVEDWTADFPDSIPPIVINISDGVSSDGSPEVAAARLCETGTGKGRTMLFNLCLTARADDPVVYPSTPRGLTSEYGRLMFAISSHLPGYMVDAATSLGIPVGDGARGFVFNGDMASLVHFLTIGTMPANMR